MAKVNWFYLAALVGLLVGCGGGGGSNGAGQVSGKVTDINGNIVAGAKITVGGSAHWTLTNSDGRYVVDSVPTQNTQISASVTLSGAQYVGSNVAWVNDGQRSKNVNIVVVAQSQTATVHAIVWDNQGNSLQNAWVYVLPTNGNLNTSAMGQTDSDGECWIPDLLAGQNYKLMANAGGYQSSPDNVNLSNGETRDINFTLGNAVNAALSPPSNVSATAWTTPSEITRSPNSAAVYKEIEMRLDPRPRRAARKLRSRSTIGGNNIEIDLFWTPIATSDPGNAIQLYGYGVYRGSGLGATTVNVDFVWDPLASFFSDLDDNLVEGQTYTYQMTSLNTLYPGTAGSESAKSAAVTASTLGDLTLGPVQFGPLTFPWTAATGATEYTLYLYDQYPSLQSTSAIWTSPTTAGTQVVYTGPALVSGHVYYYYVVGDNGSNGFTISVIAQFTGS